MLTAASRWGFFLLAYFAVWGIVGCSPPSSDPDSTGIPETPSSTEDVGSPSEPATPSGETQAAGDTQGGEGGTDSGTTTSETTTGDEGEAGHSHLIPHTGGAQGESALTRLQGERKFVRTGELLGCVDVDCQTLVIFTGWTLELIDATSGHLKISYALPEQMRHAQLSNGNVIVVDYGDPAKVYGVELSTGKLSPVCEILFYADFMSTSTQYVAFANKDKVEVQVRNLQTPTQNILTLTHNALITQLALSDAYAVASDAVGELVIWNLPSGDVVATEQDVGFVTAMVIQGDQLALATFDAILAVSTLAVYDLQQKKIVHRARVKESGETAALSWANQQVLYGTKHKGRGGVWDLNTGKVDGFEIDPVDAIHHIVASSRHWIIDHGIGSHSISFFTPTRTFWGSLQLQRERTLAFHWSWGGPIGLAGDTLLTGFAHLLKFWDIPTGMEMTKITARKLFDPAFYIEAMVVSGNRVAIAGRRRIDLLHVVTGNLIHNLQGVLQGHPPQVQVLAMDENLLVAGFDNFTMRVWNTKIGVPVGALQGHEDSITALAISNGILASASLDDTLRVWDLTSQQPLKVIKDPNIYVKALDISGDYIVYRDFDNLIIRKWNTEDPPKILAFADTMVGDASIFISDPWVISCGPDPVIRIWNFKTGEHVKSFEIASTVCALDRSRTDVIRLAGTNGQSVEVFEIDPKTLEGRVLASDTPQKLIPRRTFQVSEPSQELKINVVDHRSWFRRTWDQVQQWFQKIF